MNDIILVGTGGFLGACGRYLTGRLINRYWKNSFPMATFTVNIIGSFLLGLIVCQPELYLTRGFEYVKHVLGIGFLGAFTTFSTFEFEVLQLVEKKKYAVAGLYVTLSFIIGFSLAWAASCVGFNIIFQGLLFIASWLAATISGAVGFGGSF